MAEDLAEGHADEPAQGPERLTGAQPMADLEPLVAALSRADSLPFLFVGSGMSRRYLGHETWADLLTWAARLVGRPLEYYLGQVNGDLGRAASLIAADFYPKWWSQRKYAASRKEWSDQCTSMSSPLKIEIARRLQGKKILRKRDLRTEIKLLGSCKVDGIITTNYDSFLEENFKGFSVFVGQNDLLLRRSYQLAEIYKIHGSISAPDTMVLTAEDYESFAENSAYLVAKLISVFVEHPIIFIGYRLADPNIRVVLTSLIRCLGVQRAAEFKERFIFFDWDPKIAEPIISDHVMDLGETRLVPVLRVRTPSYLPVLEVLSNLERVLPVGLLRRVEESVVNIVHSADPTRLIRVANLEGVLKNLSDLEIVVGVGKQPASASGGISGTKGYSPLTRHDLIVDVLLDDGGLDPKEIVKTTLPTMLKHTPTAWIPVHKYVRLSGIARDDLPAVVRKAMDRRPTSPYKVPADADQLHLPDLVEIHGLTKAMNLVIKFDPDAIDVDELREVVISNLSRLQGTTELGKVMVVYDRLRYGPDAPDPIPRRASPPVKGTPSEIRAWAQSQGMKVSDRGPIAASVRTNYEAVHTA